MAMIKPDLSAVSKTAMDALNEQHAREVAELYVQNFRSYLMERAAEAADEACEKLREQIRVRSDREYSHLYQEDRVYIELSFKGKPDVSV